MNPELTTILAAQHYRELTAQAAEYRALARPARGPALRPQAGLPLPHHLDPRPPGPDRRRPSPHLVDHRHLRDPRPLKAGHASPARRGRGMSTVS
jgi:hypothetical protein